MKYLMLAVLCLAFVGCKHNEPAPQPPVVVVPPTPTPPPAQKGQWCFAGTGDFGPCLPFEDSKKECNVGDKSSMHASVGGGCDVVNCKVSCN